MSSPTSAPEPPYDVTAWSLGMLLGVDTVFVKNALPAVTMTKVDGLPKTAGEVTGTGTRFAFDYKGPDSAIAINRLLKEGARVSFDGPSHVAVSGIGRTKVEQVARDFGLNVKAGAETRTANAEPRTSNVVFHAPRVAMYQPWTGGNMDEGWTRWVLEQYEFNLTPIHNGPDTAIAITGIAGPGGGTDDKPVGTVCFTVRLADGETFTRTIRLPGDRSDIRERSTTVAMHMLRRVLSG